jgi:hypothetical protein
MQLRKRSTNPAEGGDRRRDGAWDAAFVVKGQCDLSALVFFYLRSRRQSAVLGLMRGIRSTAAPQFY